MTVATLLLALLTATNPSSGGGASDPVLLDFHADWCGPCQKMRPAIDQLSRKGYPIQSVDIDKAQAVAARYDVKAVPTFIVVDRSGRELDRTSGLQPAAVLERFYLAARAKAQPPAQSNAHAVAADDDADTDEPPARPVRRVRQWRPSDRDDDDEGARPDEARPAPAAFTNPHPAQTVVRIKVVGPHSTGFGSGTVIYSSPEESIILTCAHIFALEGRVKEVPPAQFPRQIVIDLFDGQLHKQSSGPPKVNYVESFPGRAIDYDFTRDVGLIRFRPGRQIPASRVVPAHWQPKSAPLPMKMLTVGCSEGNDATAWHTRIMNPRMKGFLQGKPAYEAIECEFAPKQGRSGGGLFTTDGYIAGVCNFAEPQGNHGLYATPGSIYALLDRNRLSELYTPVVRGSGTMVADNRDPSATRPRARQTDVARSQSPDTDEPDRRRAAVEKGEVLLPHYSFLGIKDPVVPGDQPAPRAASGTTTRRVAWHPNQTTAPGQEPAAEHAEDDREPAAGDQPQAGTSTTSPVAPTTASTKPRWRSVNAADTTDSESHDQ